jgi:hypothetical protein
LNNISVANEVLFNILKTDDTIKKTNWDVKVYTEIAQVLEHNIFPMIHLLKRVVDAKDYKDNFGIYKELVLSNGGLPEFFNYRQLIDDKNVANQRMKQILDSELVSSKDGLVKKWIHIANDDMLMSKEEKMKHLLETIPDKFQAVEFYERIELENIFNIVNPMSKLSIRNINYSDRYRDKDSKGYFLSWFNYVTGFGVWNIYVAHIEESKAIEGKGFFDSLRKENVSSKNIFLNEKGENLFLFKKFLEDHMNSGAFFLAREMDKIFETIYPKRISFFQLGPMLSNGLCNHNIDLSRLFGENPDAYFLTASREDVENVGLRNKEDIIDKMIGTKCVWNADKISEQRFGVCSKELEKPLKAFVRFPNMRFYTT